MDKLRTPFTSYHRTRPWKQHCPHINIVKVVLKSLPGYFRSLTHTRFTSLISALLPTLITGSLPRLIFLVGEPFFKEGVDWTTLSGWPCKSFFPCSRTRSKHTFRWRTEVVSDLADDGFARPVDQAFSVKHCMVIFMPHVCSNQSIAVYSGEWSVVTLTYNQALFWIVKPHN